MTKRELQRKLKKLETKLKRYKKFSWYDDLTNLFNRRKLKRDLNRLCYDYKRYRHIFMMILIDIDGFKEINDTKGHLEGDRVLKKFANIIKKAIRETDRAYRPSGDEFVIVLPHSNIKSANNVIRRIKTNAQVNISYGIDRGKKPKELLINIDKKMYENKRKNTTKNRIITGT